METFLGGGKKAKRQLQRLRKERRLPEPYWLPRLDRQRTAIYPIFALAGLIGGRTVSSDLWDRVSQLRNEVFASAAFHEMTEAFLRAVADLRYELGPFVWHFDAALCRLGETAGPAVAEWGSIVEEAEGQLENWGVRFSSELGSVESTPDQECVVAVAEHREHFPLNRVASPVPSGGVVAIQHVVVLDRGMDFVLPTIDMNLASGGPELDWSAVTFDEWESAISTPNENARSYSFERSYWEDGTAPESSGAPFSFAGIPSGREAAERLLRSRATA
jgi:hypothetical protein